MLPVLVQAGASHSAPSGCFLEGGEGVNLSWACGNYATSAVKTILPGSGSSRQNDFSLHFLVHPADRPAGAAWGAWVLGLVLGNSDTAA